LKNLQLHINDSLHQSKLVHPELNHLVNPVIAGDNGGASGAVVRKKRLADLANVGQSKFTLRREGGNPSLPLQMTLPFNLLTESLFSSRAEENMVENVLTAKAAITDPGNYTCHV
jgi:hypothetical protein